MSLSTYELAQTRLDTEEYLPDTCTIQTRSNAADGIGGQTVTWANTYTSVPCRIWLRIGGALGGREQAVGDEPTAVTVWTISVHWDQALDNTMRVVHGGYTYEVNVLNNDGTGLLQRRAWLTRLQ